MFGYLFLLFTLVPAIELLLIIEVGSHIGSVNTIGLIVLTGVAGAALARWQGFITIQKIQHSVNSGAMPNEELFDGVFILIGGIVLLTPGFLTDFLGLICLIPWTRHLMKMALKRYFERAMKEGRSVHFVQTQRPNDGYEDIDI